MAALKQVTRRDVDAVLEMFRQEADQFMAVTLGSNDYIRSVLTKALGTDRAAGLIEDILEAGDGDNGIDALNWLDAGRRSEGHTYELQALMRNSYAVFCLKKKIIRNRHEEAQT